MSGGWEQNKGQMNRNVTKKTEAVHTPLIETVAQHEVQLQGEIEAAEYEAGQIVEAARRTAASIRQQAARDLNDELIQLQSEAATARLRLREQHQHATETELGRLRQTTASQAPGVLASIMALILPNPAGGPLS